jgi:hypothetical protein
LYTEYISVFTPTILQTTTPHSSLFRQPTVYGSPQRHRANTANNTFFTMTSLGLQLNHFPAIFISFAQTLSLSWSLFGGTTSGLMQHYGLPAAITAEPKTWPVWWAGQLRTQNLGLLLGYFYVTGRYDVCDVMLASMGVWCGVGDLLVMWYVGRVDYGLKRLVGAFGVAACGIWGVTQW